MTDTVPSALPLPVVPGLSGLSVLARGGYATVYRATQESVAREVAVKVENRTLDNERDQRRFLREARAAGRMSSHPHVVDLFDAGVTADQHPYLIMELCDGSYADRMRTTPLRPVEAREVGVKIADALADAHQLGVLHRDVKPANILRSRFGEPALADFGLAILAETRDSSVTLEVLTPAYAPPEMFRHSAPSPAVDVYALCATLYAVMRGKPPRWREDRNPSLITLMELFNQPIPDLPGVPADLIEVLRAGMANDPDARPSAERLREMLAAVPLAPPPPVSPAAPQGIYVSRTYLPIPPQGSPPPQGAAPPAPARDETPTVPGARRPTGAAGLTEPVAPRRPVGPGTRSGPGRVPGGAGHRRRLGWLLGGLGVLALIGLLAAGTWYALGGPDPTPSPTGIGRSSAAPDPSFANGALPGCIVPLTGGRCPDELECYGPVEADGPTVRAARVACTGRHTWEAYAIGDLPANTDLDDAAGKLCTPLTFRRTTLIIAPEGWLFEAIPADAGTFRCLAGKGPDALTGPTLTR